MTGVEQPGAHQGTFGRLFKRAFSIGLDPGELLPDEAFAVEHGLHGGSEALKRLLLWRRGALLAALAFLLPSTLVHVVRDLIDLGADGAAGKIAGLALIGSLAGVVAGVGAFVALKRWESWARSRRVLLWTWLVAFAAPFAIALVPYGAFGASNTESVGLGVSGGLVVVLALAPKALSLFPGVMRAALTTKALFPGATLPGWVVLIAAPLHMLLVFVVMLMPYQFAGGGLMALALFCFVGAPIFLIRAGRRLARPGEREPTLATIRAARTSAALLNGAGGLFLFIGLIDIVATLKLSPLAAIAPLFEVVANALVLGIVGVDVLVLVLMRARAPHNPPDEAEARSAHANELDAFIAAQSAPPASDR